jgi:hypothetical protein
MNIHEFTNGVVKLFVFKRLELRYSSIVSIFTNGVDRFFTDEGEIEDLCTGGSKYTFVDHYGITERILKEL